MMYSSYNYGMGEVTVPSAPTAAMSPAKVEAAQRELERMRASLKGWLAARAKNDAVAAGGVVQAALRRPGAVPVSTSVFRQRLQRTRAAYETRLAADLYALLSEVFDAAALPSPDLARDPDAAVKLAEIAIAGRLPTEAARPDAQGLIWLWPLVVVLGAVAFVITSKIRNDAEVARERERYECIRAGACTDTGFWVKAAGVSVVAWLAWDKFGLREATARLRRR